MPPLLLLFLSFSCLQAANDKLQEIDYKFTLYTHTYAHEDAFLYTPTHLYGLTNQRTYTHTEAEKQAL